MTNVFFVAWCFFWRRGSRVAKLLMETDIKKDLSSPRQRPSSAARWKHNIETCASMELPKMYDNWCDTVQAVRVCVRVVSPG